MRGNKVLILLATLIVIILLLHSGGLYLHMYWRFPMYDRVVHLLASFWIALGVLHFFARIGIEFTSKRNVFIIGICATLSIGLVWEIFEYVIGQTSVVRSEFLSDTLGDIILDILGSFVGSLHAITLLKLWDHKKLL